LIALVLVIMSFGRAKPRQADWFVGQVLVDRCFHLAFAEIPQRESFCFKTNRCCRLAFDTSQSIILFAGSRHETRGQGPIVGIAE
jgi:hypothetical protein